MAEIASGSIDLKSLSVAGAPNKYITKITGDGIKIHDSQHQNENFLKLTSAGMTIYRGGAAVNNEVAFFGEDVIIGQQNSGHLTIQTDGISGYDDSGNRIMNLSYDETSEIVYTYELTDLSEENTDLSIENLDMPEEGNLELVLLITEIDGDTVVSDEFTFTVPYELDQLIEQNGTISYGEYSYPVAYSIRGYVRNDELVYVGKQTIDIVFTLQIHGSSLEITKYNITIKYPQIKEVAPHYTFGIHENALYGIHSFSEGYMTKALGDYSHAGGNNTIATGDYQAVFGRYNQENEDAIFIVGNGTSDSNRSNLMEIGENTIIIGKSTEQNILIDSDSLDIRNVDDVLATFSSNEVVVGSRDNSNIVIGDKGVAARKSDGSEYFKIGLTTSRDSQRVRAYDCTSDFYAIRSLNNGDEYESLYDSIADDDVFNIFAGVYVKYRISAGGVYSKEATYNYSHEFTKGISETHSDYSTGQYYLFTAVYTAGSNPSYSVSIDELALDELYPYGWILYQPADGSTASINRGIEAIVYTPTPSYSFGIETDVSKKLGFAIGRGTVPSEMGLAFGRYNEIDEKNDYPFMLGSGSDQNYRRTVFAISWDGAFMSYGMAGVIQMCAGEYAPQGWLFCDGSAVSRTTYNILFSAIGTKYGAGDGSTTFNLPDFRGRVPVGVGNGTATGHTNHTLGQKGGTETVTLAETHIPAHTHGSKSLTGSFRIRRWGTSGATVSSGSGIIDISDHATATANVNASTTGTSQPYQVVKTDATHTHTSFGGGTAHNNMQPYLGINYIICTGDYKLLSSHMYGY